MVQKWVETEAEGGLEPRAGVLRRRRRAELMAVLVVEVEALSRRSFSFSTISFV
jgi:hypothetical protein